ncbi:alpha/beta hydrolase [Fluoribacter dumoffii]|uniref:Predicted hydrolase of the alpha/beta-hydrolase fold n=1 Tax=Fluoribacter dumoffii TaxID=463 RepID=A0A377G628_9GAMM|nr:alpha/beta hydrolase [Fluoribacter dumoffii]KTC92496.1 alpha/beta superfamily transporter hydrolase [Fluoribacter dumoffii NY 23]STO20272.1 Predicted hydrolase of the alpha/beta-hydrolase fold [Fluoribacter dumoffii]
MQITEKLALPGEHPLLLQGAVGRLEAVLTVPEQNHSAFIAFLGHPHSLQGGSMSNKVVTTLARVFRELGIPSLRFNFRGVGHSEGSYDAGLGESEDMLVLVREWQKEQPEKKLIFAGFSFGSYVAYRAAAQSDAHLLITVAPAVNHYNYSEFVPPPHPWLIVQGDEDEVVPSNQVFEFATQAVPEIPVLPFANTGHFFHGKLIELKAKLIEYIHSQAVL